MATRRYTIRETKSPSMHISLFEVSKGAVQAARLGLKPTPPDFDAIRRSMVAKPGTAVAYELTYDGSTLSFGVSVGGKALPALASIQPRKDLASLARLEVMRQLLNYRLATAADVAAAEAATTVEAKAHELRVAVTTVTVFKRELATMKSEKRIRDLSAASLAKFRAWAGRAGLGGPILLIDFADRGGWSAGMFDAKTLAYLELAPSWRKVAADLEAGGSPDVAALQVEVMKTLDAKMLRSYHAHRLAKELKPGLEQALGEVKRIEQEIRELRKLASR